MLRVRTKATKVKIQTLGKVDRAGLRKKWELLKTESRVFNSMKLGYRRTKDH